MMVFMISDMGESIRKTIFSISGQFNRIEADSRHNTKQIIWIVVYIALHITFGLIALA